MNLTTIQDAIYSWANGFLNSPDPRAVVFWGESNGPRPDNPSVRLKLIAGPGMLGLDELRPVPNDPDLFRVVGPRRLMLSISAYGDAALQIISDLQTSLSNPEFTAALGLANVSTLETSSPRDLSTALDTKFEQRYQMDVTLLATEDASSEPGVIESVEGTSSFGGVDGEFQAGNDG